MMTRDIKAILGLIALSVAITAWSAADPEGIKKHEKCSNCHKTHEAKEETRLLTLSTVREVCLNCHLNIESAPEGMSQGIRSKRFEGMGSAVSTHPGIQANDSRVKRFIGTVVKSGGRQSILEATCSGCHDVHTRTPNRGYLGKTLSFSAQGNTLNKSPSADYEICFGCHGDKHGYDQQGRATPVIFGVSANSAHPVGNYGKGFGSVSLLQSSPKFLSCQSCHGDSENFLAGPHYSREPYLLAFHYETGDGILETEQSYTLCYRCHDRLSILGDQSFKLHRAHIKGDFSDVSPEAGYGLKSFNGMLPKKATVRAETGYRNRSLRTQPSRGSRAEGSSIPTSCHTCHDANGSLDFSRLIAFDGTVVSPATNGTLSFRSLGPGSGECTLYCHGYDHIHSRY